MTFDYEGQVIQSHEGDTVASALYRSGRRIFTRSFKYHRPRGLLCCSGKCPNCLMNVDGSPNVRTCVTPVREGMRVTHQNAWPSLENDALSIVQHFDRLMPVGWYYKTLTHPRVWHAAEPYIRKVAGLGVAGKGDPREYEHAWLHVDVAVIGGGPAGIHAALESSSQNQTILLIDDQPELGGHLRYRPSAGPVPAEKIAALRAKTNVEILANSSCFGLYEGNLLGVLERHPHQGAAERLIHVRARQVVVATGAYETPLPFVNNDLVGVMLSTAVQRLYRLHKIVAGAKAVIIGAGQRATEVASDLQAAGAFIAATIAPVDVLSALGSTAVTGVDTRTGSIPCDVIVVCGPLVPDAGLVAQAGGRLAWQPTAGAFLPTDLPDGIQVTGGAAGQGLEAVPALAAPGKRTFICLCTDATAQDLSDGIAEGFDQIEMLKRYTTTTMGPCQGRMCQLLASGFCAAETRRAMGDTGVTTSRPPNPSVTLGALAGPRHHPIRRTPMHYAHQAAGAVWMDMGEWKRPRYYRTGQDAASAAYIDAEYRAVREHAGLIDVSTLGKLDIRGRDAGKLLDKVYTSRFSDLRPGRVRYGVICDEAGVMLDDGTVSCLGNDRYFVTTTTGNLDFVNQWLEWWLAGSGWDVDITNVTGGYGAMNLAGPQARQVLSQLTDCDLSTPQFPYMACREAHVAGVACILMRIGFVGETGWEIHCPAESAEELWSAILTAGRDAGLLPFGVEAQRLLRLEKRHVIVGVDTDALTNPFEAGMAWVAKFDKDDFIGKSALEGYRSATPREQLIGFVLPGKEVPDEGAAIVVNGKPAGRVTSSRYSPAAGNTIGLAWVQPAQASEGERIYVRLNGSLAAANVTMQVFYDPEGARLRQ